MIIPSTSIDSSLPLSISESVSPMGRKSPFSRSTCSINVRISCWLLINCLSPGEQINQEMQTQTHAGAGSFEHTQNTEKSEDTNRRRQALAPPPSTPVRRSLADL